MFARFIEWVKDNKFTSLLLVVLVWLLFGQSFSTFLPVDLGISNTQTNNYRDSLEYGASGSKVGQSISDIILPPTDNYPPSETNERMVITNTSISMVVLNIRETVDKVLTHAKAVGGYMVNTSVTNPIESPTGTITVRIPSEKIDASLDYFRSLAEKVTLENINGRDVTDEYIDIESRIAQLNKTLAQVETIREKAETAEDLLRVQSQITNLQNQIDNLKGRQKYLEQSAKYAKVTLTVATDELALPFAPPESFRPEVVFRYAVRSLLGTLGDIGSVIVWVVVYSILWGPALIILLLWRKRIHKKQ